jgi:polyhydroxyalkanoate synthesis regulator phasin
MSPEQAPQAEFEVVVDQNMLPPVAPVPVEPPAVVQPLPQNGLEPVQVISEPSPAPVQATADDLLAQVPDKIGEISSAVEGHNEDLAAVKEQVDQLSNQVAALLEAQDEDSIASLEAEIEQLKLTVSQLQAFKVEVEKASAGEPAAELSDETLAKLKGRKRVGGLLVTDVSRSGEMSVIKRPSTNRVFTLFTGEVLNLPQGRQVVGEVLEQGNVVLLGTDYFIDRTLDPIPTAKPRPTKSTAAKKSAPAEPRQPKAPDEPKVISGYSLNAIYDAEKSFGIINSKGDFEAVTKGQSIKGLGTVKGLDSQGNLLVGDGVIRSVY